MNRPAPRVPAVAGATGLLAKMRILWTSQGGPPPSDGLVEKLTELESLTVATSTIRPAPRVERIFVRGMGSLVGPVEYDIANTKGSLIAIGGPVGAGKSTLLELAAGAIYRDTPTRGDLDDLATSKDAVLEVDVTSDAAYRIRHTFAGKGAVTVKDAAGDTIFAGGRQAFDAWAADHFLIPELFFAGPFRSQKAPLFHELKKGERKAILIRFLGIERLEKMAAAARERARDAASEAKTFAARVQDARGRAAPMERAQAVVDATTLAAGEAHAAASSRATELRAAEADYAAAVERHQAEILRASHEEAARRTLADVRIKIGNLEERIANNRRVLEEGGAIRDAVKQTDALREELATLEAQRNKYVNLLAAEGAEEIAARRSVDDAKATRQMATEALRAGEARLAALQEQIARAPRPEDVAPQLQEAGETFDRNERKIQVLQDQLVFAATDRIRDLRHALSRVAREQDGPSSARDALAKDDDAAKRGDLLPGLISAAKAARADLEAKLKALRASADEASRAEELRGAIAIAEAHVAEKSVAVQTIERDMHARRSVAVEAEERIKAIEASLAAAKADVAACNASILRLAPLVRHADQLAIAGARIEELTGELAVAQVAAQAAAEELTRLEGQRVEAPKPTPPVAQREALAGAQRTAERCAAAVDAATAELRRAERAAAELAELEASHAAVASTCSDWTRLGNDLGRDGLQALEIDAAGPELTELANELLRTCESARWSVSIETQRRSSDGKRDLEGCEVRVLDQATGREGEGRSLSGGEAVIVGEAISLALCALACRRAGARDITLVRDESGAALDPASARAYVGMLRRAADMVGASKVLFVSHSPEVREMADAQINMGGP